MSINITQHPFNTSKPAETLSSYIEKDINYTVSHQALFKGFQHRMRVESLKCFIV